MKKKFSLKIAGKIGLGFGVLTLAVIFNTVLINNELDKSRVQNEKTSKVYQPFRGIAPEHAKPGKQLSNAYS